jgi:prevent-host-death family protein
MRSVGAFEAKTHLSQLLEEVAAGGEVLITRHGRGVAKLVPVEPPAHARRIAAVQALQRFSDGKRLNGLSLQALRDEGRQR